MGFGVLFIGYMLVALGVFVPFGFVMRLGGYALMAIAFLKLKEFGTTFIYQLIISVIMTIYGIYCAVYQGAEKLSIPLPGIFESAAGVMLWIGLAGTIALNLLIAYSTYKIASDVDLSKPKNAAVRNSIIISLFGILAALWLSPVGTNDFYKKYFGLPMILALLASMVLYLTMIFSCYMYICPEGDEDMPRRESKLEFVNKMRTESDRRTEQAVRETEEYVRKKQKDRLERLEQKNNKNRKNRG